jgi:hypothetical protein
MKCKADRGRRAITTLIVNRNVIGLPRKLCPKDVRHRRAKTTN